MAGKEFGGFFRRLEDADIAQQIPEREHPRQYVAGEILRILGEDL